MFQYLCVCVCVTLSESGVAHHTILVIIAMFENIIIVVLL